MTEKGKVTCRDTTWLVSDARDRPLTEGERASLADHIAECSLCQGASKQFKPGENERLAVVVALDDAGFEGEQADFAGPAPPQPELMAQLTPGVERRAYRLS